jgi:hypothetical protein
MLTICYSPKGGQGCTTITASFGLLAPNRLIDIGDDLSDMLGVPKPLGPGICDLLAGEQTLTLDAIENLGHLNHDTTRFGGVETVLRSPRNVMFISAGSTHPDEVPTHRWTELSTLLADSPESWFIDAGTVRAANDIDGHRIMVVRNCYLALRRAVAHPIRPDSVILVTEPGRALTVKDVEAVLPAPVTVQIAIDPSIARTIDAGVLSSRLPKALEQLTSAH